MPDHCHFLWQGTEEQSNLRQAVKHFKQSTGFYFQKRTGRRLWQKNYFDHILRKEEKIMTVCQYIFENPVRAGLVGDYRDYPYSGSMVFDWKNFPL
jgi:REP element-mobilizing transposase RayT